MTTHEGRWAQIVFWNRADLEELHRREIAREKQSDARGAAHKPAIETWDHGFIEQMQEQRGLVPFWDTLLPETVRADRMNQFCRSIYHLWKPMFGMGSSEPDMTTLHKADLAIFNFGLKTNRGSVNKYSDRQVVRESPRAGVD